MCSVSATVTTLAVALPIPLPSILDWAALFEFIGAVLIVGYIVAALIALLRPGERRLAIVRARELVARGVIWGLDFKLAGSLLKTIELHTFEQIGLFVVIFALRTILKHVFAWELGRLRAAERAH